MNDQSLALIVSAALVLLALLYSLIGWNRRRSPRALLHGIAGAVLVVGAWLTGVMALLADAARATVEWGHRQSLTTRMWAGIICAGVGALLYVIASFLARVSPEEGRRRRENARQRRLGLDTPAGVTAGPAAGAAGPVRTGADEPTRPSERATRPPAGSDDFDEDEITTILQRRGIE